MKTIDFRSDTVTKPTPAMRAAMQTAEVGDDVYGDDPTVNRLEALSAKVMGKESALFVPSGTMGNQLAIMTHTNPGEEIIAGMKCHIIHYEAAAPRLSGVGCAAADNPDQKIYPEDIIRLVRSAGHPFYPRTSLLCVENALSNGDVVSVDLMRETYQTAKQYGLAVHLDGARIFNAAHALGVAAEEIARYADSVMFCVSKGLCAPVGSLLCGNADFIAKARKYRKLIGGGMRQAGVLAACGIIAVEEMSARIGEDHDNARYLGGRLERIPGVEVDVSRIRINMVYWRPTVQNFDGAGFVSFMRRRGILINGADQGTYRFITHNDISREDVDTAAEALDEFIRQSASQ